MLLLDSVLPSPIDLTKTVIGPKSPEQKGDREQYLLKFNETASLTDELFKSRIICGNQDEYDAAPDNVKLVTESRDMISQHLERRVANFLNQLVVSYKTNLHFEIGFTEHQGESSKALEIAFEQLAIKKVTRNAAHSSTIPSIYAYDKTAWDAYVENGGDRPQGFIYIKNSDCYKGNNSTLSAIRDINEADIVIDGNPGHLHLRQTAINLLNESSLGNIDPQAGIIAFVDALAAITEAKKGEVAKPGVKKALEIYSEELVGIKRAVRDSSMIDHLLNIKISDATTEELNRRVYNLRFKAIRDNQIAQTKMHMHIENWKGHIYKKLKLTKKPPNFDEIFKHVVVSVMRTEADKIKMKKFWNLGPMPLRAEKTKRLIESEKLYLTFLVSALSSVLLWLDHDEVVNRSLVSLALRESSHLTQRELSRRIALQFPDIPNSQSSISRMENRVRIIDADYAIKLSKVYNVDPCVFIPQFFNE